MAEIIPLNTPLERYSLMAVALLVVIACLTAAKQATHVKTGQETARLQDTAARP